METVLISGGSGMIGTALASLLVHQGYQVRMLTRQQKPPRQGISYFVWNVDKGELDKNALAGADHLIHLAGAGIADKRWSSKRKEEICNSRVNAAQLLVRAMNDFPNKIRTVVAASAIGWYGPDQASMIRGFVETDPAANDFLGNTCRVWEESILPVNNMEKRLVILRTGIVLCNAGGAFPEFVKPMKAGIAGILGSGRQVVSWIHIDDVCRLYLWALVHSPAHGVYNATAPEPVTNKQLTLAIAKKRGKPFIAVHIPAIALQVYMGEMKVEVLKSTTVDDAKLRNEGFRFLFPSLESALNDLI